MVSFADALSMSACQGRFDVVGFGIGGSVPQEVEQIDQICCIEATFLRRRRPAKAYIHVEKK